MWLCGACTASSGWSWSRTLANAGPNPLPTMWPSMTMSMWCTLWDLSMSKKRVQVVHFVELRLVPSSSSSSAAAAAAASPKNDDQGTPPFHIPVRPSTNGQDPQNSTIRNFDNDRLYLVQVRQTFQAPCCPPSSFFGEYDTRNHCSTAYGVRLQTGHKTIHVVGWSYQDQPKSIPRMMILVPPFSCPTRTNERTNDEGSRMIAVLIPNHNRSQPGLLPR